MYLDILKITAILLAAWWLIPRLLKAVGISIYTKAQIRAVESRLDNVRRTINSDWDKLRSVFSVDALGYQPVDAADSPVEKPADKGGSWAAFIRLFTRPSPRAFFVIGAIAMLLWPLFLALNATVVVQILELFLPVTGAPIVIPYLGEFNPMGLVLAILIALAGAIFAFTIHIKSPMVRILGFSLCLLLVFFEGLGGWLRGEYIDRYLVDTVGTGLLSNPTPMVSAAIAVLVVSAEMLCSYVFLRGIIIPINVQPLRILAILPLLVVQFVGEQMYGPFFEDFQTEVDDTARAAAKLIKEASTLRTDAATANANSRRQLTALGKFINNVIPVTPNDTTRVKPSTAVTAFKDRLIQLEEKVAVYREMLEWDKQDTPKNLPAEKDYKEFSLAALTNVKNNLEIEMDTLTRDQKNLNDHVAEEINKAFEECTGNINSEKKLAGIEFKYSGEDEAERRRIENEAEQLKNTVDDLINRSNECSIEAKKLVARVMDRIGRTKPEVMNNDNYKDCIQTLREAYISLSDDIERLEEIAPCGPNSKNGDNTDSDNSGNGTQEEKKNGNGDVSFITILNGISEEISAAENNNGLIQDQISELQEQRVSVLCEDEIRTDGKPSRKSQRCFECRYCDNYLLPELRDIKFNQDDLIDNYDGWLAKKIEWQEVQIENVEESIAAVKAAEALEETRRNVRDLELQREFTRKNRELEAERKRKLWEERKKKLLIYQIIIFLAKFFRIRRYKQVRGQTSLTDRYKTQNGMEKTK